MLRFVVALLPAVALAAQSPQLAISTTPSPESVYLNLAASADAIVGQPKIGTKFSCAYRSLGYYADIENDCKIYHICNPSIFNDEHVVLQYSFYCPVGQTFDQQVSICVPTSSTPCHESEKYYTLETSTRPHKPLVTTGTTTAIHTPAQTVHVAAPTTVVTVPAAAPVAAPVHHETVHVAAPTTTVVTAPAAAPVVAPVHHETVHVAAPTTPVATAPATVTVVAPVRHETVPAVKVESVPTAATATVAVEPTLTFQPVLQPAGQHLLRHQHQQQAQQVTYPIYTTNQAAHFIKHFPEPNYHLISDPSFAKVLRLG